MDRILRHNHAGVGVGGVCTLQHSLDQFAAECEVAVIRMSTFESEAMVLSRRLVDCPLRIGNGDLTLHQAVQVS